jgi:hypothetical protein
MIESIRWDGTAISVPGVYRDVPLDDYHRGDICDEPSVSSTPLRQLWNKSPAHCWAHSPLNPRRVAEKEDEARILGRATHHLICGEIGFADQYVIRSEKAPDGRAWNGNNETCKQWIKNQKRMGKTVLTPTNVEQIEGMAISLGNFPLVQQGALNGLIERSFFWKDAETGLWLKARPDAIPSDSGDFSDLKTTRSVIYRDLEDAVGEYGYQQQAALVLEGARALGIPAESFTLIWCEKNPPHCVRAQQLKDEDIVRGTKMNRVALRKFAECLASGVWPGPGDDRPDAEFVDLADWRRKQIDERLRLQLNEAA